MPRVNTLLEIINELPRELPKNVLPTRKDVILAVHYAKRSEVNPSARVPWKTYENTVAEQLLEIWKRASIPTIQPSSVVRNLEILNTNFRQLLNAPKTRRESRQFLLKVMMVGF